MQHSDEEHTTRLRLGEGLAFIAANGGWLVEGGVRRRRFTGAAAAPMVDVLVPALRTWRTLRELVDVTGLPEGTVTAMVAHLGRSGLIEEQTEAGLTQDATMDAEARTFLSRALEEIDGYRNVDQIAHRFSRCTVVHLGDSPVAEAICADLRSAGVGQVILSGDGMDPAVRPTLILLPGTVRPPADLPQGTEVLRYGAAADRIEIGPLFGRVGSVCFPCFEASHRSAFGEDDGSAPLSSVHLLAGLVVNEALALCAAITEPQAVNTLGVVDLASLTQTTYTLVPERGCPRCGERSTAEHYEDQVAENVARLNLARSDSQRDARRLAAEAVRRPLFPTSPRRLLGPREDVRVLSGTITRLWAETGPDVEAPAPEDALAGILLRVGGRRTQAETGRFAASGGNMASVELYAVADGAAFGFPAGTLLKYDDLDHAVLVPRTGQMRAGELCGLDPAGRIAVLFFVGGVKRLAAKYGRFSYRLALLDAGCALAQLSAVCHGYGLRAVQAPHLDEAVSGELDLLDGAEIVSAAVGIYRKDSPCR